MTDASGTYYWIGLTNANTEEKWLWIDGLDVTWTNWKEGWDHVGNCAAIHMPTGTWYAQQCSEHYRFVCKVPLNW